MPVDSPITVSKTIRNGGTNRDGSKRVFGRWTFEYRPAREFVEERLQGRVLNACAGKTHLDYDGEIVRNDLNREMDADFHVDVDELADHFDPLSFDTIVFDPPYDDIQAVDKYDSLRADGVLRAFDQFTELVRPGGAVITFGWNSWGMRSHDVFDREETVLFQRGPVKRDVIATVDRRNNWSLQTDAQEVSD
jgi:threonine dehydrogenase-like Zn-dependent dehydrogenase